ncbi:MAG: hypothetical protein ACJ79E_20490, partial [Anaeromyxobacteraceae bacterium]
MRRPTIPLRAAPDPAPAGDALVAEGLRLVAALGGERLEEEVLAALARATDAQGAALWVLEGAGALHLAASAGVTARGALPRTLDAAEAPLARALRAGTPDDAPGAAPGEALRVPL